MFSSHLHIARGSGSGLKIVSAPQSPPGAAFYPPGRHLGRPSAAQGRPGCPKASQKPPQDTPEIVPKSTLGPPRAPRLVLEVPGVPPERKKLPKRSQKRPKSIPTGLPGRSKIRGSDPLTGANHTRPTRKKLLLLGPLDSVQFPLGWLSVLKHLPRQ